MSSAASSAPSALSAMCLPGTASPGITRWVRFALKLHGARPRLGPAAPSPEECLPAACVGSLPWRISDGPAAAVRSAHARRAGVVGASHQRATGFQALDEAVEHRAVWLGAAR